MKQYLFALIFLSSCLALQAQDTLRIHFATGKFSLGKQDEAKLRQIPQKYDLSKAIRIEISGYADSSGTLKSNLRLSEQRALSVQKACKPFLKEGLPCEAIGRGERACASLRDCRIVEFVIHYPPNQGKIEQVLAENSENSQSQPVAEEPNPEKANQLCTYPANRLLHWAGKREIVQNGRPYVMLEWDNLDEFKGRKFYWARMTAADTLQYQPLRMERRETGRKWWSERRFSALIPKSSFEQWQVFEFGKTPCDVCSIDLATEKNDFLCRQTDRFLMENLQVRKWWIGHDYIRIRVPKEYVDLKAKYFIGCHNLRLYWEEGKKGRKSDYCFAKLPIRRNLYLENIVKESPCCEAQPEPSECDANIHKLHPIEPRDMGLSVTTELGSLIRPVANTYYLGLLGNLRTSHQRYESLIGLDQNGGPLMRFGANHVFLLCPTSAILPFSAWRKPGKIRDNTAISLYAGNNFWWLGSKENKSAIWAELHAGISLDGDMPWSDTQFWRLFVQPGLGLDIKQRKFQPSPMLNLGLVISILH
jgi:hypothetical protein